MTIDEKDPILAREFRDAMDTGSPQPAWNGIAARAGVFSRHSQRRRLRVALAVALVAIAVPTLGFAARSMLSEGPPPGLQKAIDSFATLGGPSNGSADDPVVVAEPRRVLTLPLANGATAALWAVQTVDGNYCFDTQVLNDAWPPGGYGAASFPGPGCGKHDLPLEVGYDFPHREGLPHALIAGGSGLRAADSVEIKYQDGSSDTIPTVYAASPIDATFFMFQVATGHYENGSRPIELILRAQDGSVLARDETALSNLWVNYGQNDGGVAARPNLTGYGYREPQP